MGRIQLNSPLFTHVGPMAVWGLGCCYLRVWPALCKACQADSCLSALGIGSRRQCGGQLSTNFGYFSVFFWWFYENKKDARRPYDHFGGGIAPRSLLCVRKRRFPFWGGAHVLSGSDFLNAISYFLGPIWFSDPTFLFFWPGKSESEFLMTTFSYTRIWV